MSDQEEWRSIPGYEGKYIISNQGVVKSLPRNGTVNQIRQIKTTKNRGYEIISLRDGSGKKKTHSMHRLVMLAFHGPSELQVDHLNSIKDDNRLCNLEYVHEGENSRRYHNAKHKSVYNPELVQIYEKNDTYCAFILDGDNRVKLGEYENKAMAYHACDTFLFIYRS